MRSSITWLEWKNGSYCFIVYKVPLVQEMDCNSWGCGSLSHGYFYSGKHCLKLHKWAVLWCLGVKREKKVLLYYATFNTFSNSWVHLQSSFLVSGFYFWGVGGFNFYAHPRASDGHASYRWFNLPPLTLIFHFHVLYHISYTSWTENHMTCWNSSSSTQSKTNYHTECTFIAA